MAKKLIVVLLLVVMPLCISAKIYYVPSAQYPTFQDALNKASDGDTILVTPDIYAMGYSTQGKDITVGIDATEPDDLEAPDSTHTGPTEPFPPTPVE